MSVQSPRRNAVPFGTYLLLDRINIGGMAEVWRGKSFGARGFERLVAIKRILPHIAEEADFKSMFIDEAKLSVLLNHANIAQVYELGELHRSLYIAMEYVAGKDLRFVFERSRKEKDPLPIPLVCHIIQRAAEGLDYAHRKKDQGGRELNIVHRDVSPQNILLSFDGEVKVIDFGIAKAAGRGSTTQTGVLKGKFGYMSPEQVLGEKVDRRSDVFALGVCLFELLTGERLFTGESDFSVLEKVANIEAQSLRGRGSLQGLPEALVQIVSRALAKSPEDRYPYASDLGEDLERYLHASGHLYGRKDLMAFMQDSFGEDIDKEQQRQQDYATIEAPPEILAALERAESQGGRPPHPSAGEQRLDLPPAEPAVAASDVATSAGSRRGHRAQVFSAPDAGSERGLPKTDSEETATLGGPGPTADAVAPKRRSRGPAPRLSAPLPSTGDEGAVEGGPELTGPLDDGHDPSTDVGAAPTGTHPSPPAHRSTQGAQVGVMSATSAHGDVLNASTHVGPAPAAPDPSHVLNQATHIGPAPTAPSLAHVLNQATHVGPAPTAPAVSAALNLETHVGPARIRSSEIGIANVSTHVGGAPSKRGSGGPPDGETRVASAPRKGEEAATLAMPTSLGEGLELEAGPTLALPTRLTPETSVAAQAPRGPTTAAGRLSAPTLATPSRLSGASGSVREKGMGHAPGARTDRPAGALEEDTESGPRRHPGSRGEHAGEGREEDTDSGPRLHPGGRAEHHLDMREEESASGPRRHPGLAADRLRDVRYTAEEDTDAGPRRHAARGAAELHRRRTDVDPTDEDLDDHALDDEGLDDHALDDEDLDDDVPESEGFDDGDGAEDGRDAGEPHEDFGDASEDAPPTLARPRRLRGSARPVPIGTTRFDGLFDARARRFTRRDLWLAGLAGAAVALVLSLLGSLVSAPASSGTILVELVGVAPSQATVRLAGKRLPPVRQYPVRATAPLGEVEVELSAEGYRPARHRVRLSAPGEVAELRTALEPL